MRGEATRRGRHITLRVTTRSTSDIVTGPCLTMGGVYLYRAVLGELAPGAYHLRVIHRYEGRGSFQRPVELVLEEDVVVKRRRSD